MQGQSRVGPKKYRWDNTVYTAFSEYGFFNTVPVCDIDVKNEKRKNTNFILKGVLVSSKDAYGKSNNSWSLGGIVQVKYHK